MPMFSELPTDVLRTVFETYLFLDTKQLSRLDVALCNRKMRPDLLSIFQQVKPVGEAVAAVDECWMGYEAPHLQNYLDWVISRAVRVSALRVNIGLMPGLIFPKHPIALIESLEIVAEGPNACKKPMYTLITFLDNLSSLQMLSFAFGISDTLRDEDLLQLQKLRCRVEGLDLRECTQLSSCAIAKLACSFGGFLRTLRCDEMHDDDMALLTEHCSCMTDLYFTLAGESYHNFEQFCIASAQTLTTLRICLLSTETVLKIASTCVNMKHINVSLENAEDTTMVVLYILAHCPKVVEVGISNLTVTIVTSEGGHRTAEILQESHDDSTLDYAALFDAMPIHIHECTFNSLGCRGGAALNSLGEHNCTTLNTLHLIVQEPQYHDNILNLLRRCTSLADVTIGMRSRVGLVELMPLLPAACSNLRKMTVGSCFFAPTDDDFAPFLEAFRTLPTNAVESFTFPMRSSLTANILHGIATAFPHLRVLALEGTVTKALETVLLDLIVSGKLKAKRVNVHQISSCRWISEGLMKQGIKNKILNRCIHLAT